MKPNNSTDRNSSNRGITRRGTLRAGAAASVALVTGLAILPGSAAARNKAELIDSIASEADVTKADAKKALDAFIDTTTKALKKGNRVALVGFGSFSISKRSARKGRNPQTGKEIKIPAKKTVEFEADDELAAALDLIPGRGDERRLRARKKKEKKKKKENGKKKDKKKPRRRDGVVIDAELLVRRAEELSADAAARVIEAFIAVMAEKIKDKNRGDEGAAVDGLGSFSISKRSARKGRNPQTGKEIKIPAKKVVKFKPGAELSEKIT
jgi:nucleoid DNA-binding protein